MKLSPATLQALVRVVTGGPHGQSPSVVRYGPYRSGPQLIHFFDSDEMYGRGFGSRKDFAEGELYEINGTPRMKEIVESAVDPRHFVELDDLQPEQTADFLNQYLEHDGFRLVKVRGRHRVRKVGGFAVESAELSFAVTDERREFIDEYLEKCDRRLAENDFSGAITTARTLVEEVLLNVERLLDPDPPDYNGKLSSLYTRVYRLLNLDPGQKGLQDSQRQILSGLISVVHGIAPMRNQSSDSHPLEYRPRRHHAELAVNAAKTFVAFLDGTLAYQMEQGHLTPIPHSSEAE